MGRHSYSSRFTVEECLRINVYLLVNEIKRKFKEKLPNASKAEIGSCLARIIELEGFTASRDNKFVQTISFHKTPSNLGFGFRYWLLCPRCGRKVVNLYFPPYGHKYLCRSCHNLTYKSQKEHDKRVDALLMGGISPGTILKTIGIKGLGLLLKAQMKIESMEESKGKDVNINIDLGSFGKK
jgi:hypothetical protein